MKTRKIIIALLLCYVAISFYGCSFFSGTNKSDNSTDSITPSKEQVEANEKKQFRENIAKYVDVEINKTEALGGFCTSFYVVNNTNYTIESVVVAIGWEENGEVNTTTKEFTYIPAHGQSTWIDLPSYAKNAKAQIASIKCSAIGL